MKILPFKVSFAKISTKELVAKLSLYQYSSIEATGFSLEEVQRNKLVASFIRKVEETKTITDPLGLEIKYESITYQNIRFSLIFDKGLLLVEAMPRSSRYFFSLLEKAFGVGFCIEPWKVDLPECLIFLRKEGDFIMKEISFKGIKTDKSSIITATAKGEHLEEDLLLNFKQYESFIESFSGTFESSRTGCFRLRIQKNGAVNFSSFDEDWEMFLLDVLDCR